MRSYARILSWMAVAVGAFHAAYASSYGSILMILYLFALLQLAQAEKWRKAFYPGLAVGLLIATVRLAFFWRLFSGGALALWVVYAFWVGLFVALARLCFRRWRWGWFLVPFVWTGLEYFRSELYYLRFSWLNVGYAFTGAPWQAVLKMSGVYGVGFLLMSLAAVAACRWQRSRPQAAIVLLLAAGGIWLCGSLVAGGTPRQPLAGVRIAGVQMEVPSETEVFFRLNELVQRYPDAELLVLSEYTLDGPVTQKLSDWCRRHSRYLIVGGKDPAPSGKFYNTAFVVSPKGEVIFRQVKAVPIQFFKDGLPAPAQELWNSPWGRVGICICYDLSYARVIDKLVSLGAQALIVPTMDVADWGEAQHELHARVAPARATEYCLPIFRLASSGISQWVDRDGRVLATAPCPGDGAMLAGTIVMGARGRLPLDRWLAPFAVGATAFLIVWFLAGEGRHMIRGGARKSSGSQIAEIERAVSSASNHVPQVRKVLTPTAVDSALGTARRILS